MHRQCEGCFDCHKGVEGWELCYWDPGVEARAATEDPAMPRSLQSMLMSTVPGLRKPGLCQLVDFTDEKTDMGQD